VSDVLVLCYHALSPTWPAQLSTTPERFAEQLGRLQRRGWHATTFLEAIRSPQGRRTVAVTFDDAFRSVATLAKPVLDDLGWPATLFVPTDFPAGAGSLSWDGIEQWRHGAHAGELAALTWPEIRDLAESGWEIGSHTCSHPRLTTVSDEALARELQESKTACEQQLARPCATLAYPYGDVDARVVAATVRAGYEAAAALPARPHGPRRHEWPRIGVYHKDGPGRLRLKLWRARLVGGGRAG
jgi:peptidoglycan/xylan/chitin deacetylase (PgdA/CDA1 family)